MSRNIPVPLRHKSPQPARVKAMSYDLSVTMLRAWAVLGWCVCLGLFCAAIFDLVRNSHAGFGPWLSEPAGYVAGCLAGILVGWRVWVVKRWACYLAVAVTWLFSIGEPWRPIHYTGGVVDPSAAVGACVLIALLLAVPVTAAAVVTRKRMRPGF